MIFDDIDKKLRSFDSRLAWVEDGILALHNGQRSNKERLESLYDDFQHLKELILKGKVEKKNV